MYGRVSRFVGLCLFTKSTLNKTCIFLHRQVLLIVKLLSISSHPIHPADVRVSSRVLPAFMHIYVPFLSILGFVVNDIHVQCSLFKVCHRTCQRSCGFVVYSSQEMRTCASSADILVHLTFCVDGCVV